MGASPSVGGLRGRGCVPMDGSCLHRAAVGLADSGQRIEDGRQRGRSDSDTAMLSKTPTFHRFHISTSKSESRDSGRAARRRMRDFKLCERPRTIRRLSNSPCSTSMFEAVCDTYTHQTANTTDQAVSPPHTYGMPSLRDSVAEPAHRRARARSEEERAVKQRAEELILGQRRE